MSRQTSYVDNYFRDIWLQRQWILLGRQFILMRIRCVKNDFTANFLCRQLFASNFPMQRMNCLAWSYTEPAVNVYNENIDLE